MALQLPCSECDGDGRLWRQTDADYFICIGVCPQCDGEKAERCSECDKPAVDIYSHTSRGQTFSHPVCATHLAEWLEDEAA